MDNKPVDKTQSGTVDDRPGFEDAVQEAQKPAHHPKQGHKQDHEHRKCDEKITEMEKKLAEVTAKYEEMLEIARRVKAEYENFKKRSETILLDQVDMEKSRIILDFLPVFDNLERALAAADKDKSGEFSKGVEMIVRQFKTCLDRMGVTGIDAKGVDFDPEIHEAMSVKENPCVKCDTVAEVFQPGYSMKGRVIRHAKVVVDRPADKVEPKKQESKQDEEETGII